LGTQEDDRGRPWAVATAIVNGSNEDKDSQQSQSDNDHSRKLWYIFFSKFTLARRAEFQIGKIWVFGDVARRIAELVAGTRHSWGLHVEKGSGNFKLVVIAIRKQKSIAMTKIYLVATRRTTEQDIVLF
jgi:hypothetical protein